MLLSTVEDLFGPFLRPSNLQKSSFIESQIFSKKIKISQNESIRNKNNQNKNRNFDIVFDPYNDRVKLIGIYLEDFIQYFGKSALLETMDTNTPWSKLIVYTLEGFDEEWCLLGFTKEGLIENFFKSGNNAVIWSIHSPKRRARDIEKLKYEKVIQIAKEKKKSSKKNKDKNTSESINKNVSKENFEPQLPSDYSSEIATLDHVLPILNLLNKIFVDYPTPLTEEKIRSSILNKDNLFRIVRDENKKIIAVASGEMDHHRSVVEMTDCATLPEYRGKGLMYWILKKLEDDIRSLFQITDYYTLARASEAGMNCVFSKLGYSYRGLLEKNCRMPTGYESVNIWCKQK